MEDGVTSAEVKAAVDACNEALKNVDQTIGGIESLNVVDDLRAIAGRLHQSWETKNGEATMIELFKVFDSLETYTNSLSNAAKNIKSDEYTLDTSKTTTEKVVKC